MFRSKIVIIGLAFSYQNIIPGVQLKSGPYGPYFNIGNLFTQWQTTPKNLWT